MVGFEQRPTLHFLWQHVDFRQIAQDGIPINLSNTMKPYLRVYSNGQRMKSQGKNDPEVIKVIGRGATLAKDKLSFSLASSLCPNRIPIFVWCTMPPNVD